MEEDLDKIIEILTNTEVIAVVGISRDPEKNSCTVPEYLQDHGYRIIPVNPYAADGKMLGEVVYESLLDIPDPVDMVQIFRPSEEVPPIAESAVQIGAKYLWMQSGIRNEDAKKTAEAAGLLVVMDMCARVCHRLLTGQGKL